MKHLRSLLVAAVLATVVVSGTGCRWFKKKDKLVVPEGATPGMTLPGAAGEGWSPTAEGLPPRAGGSFTPTSDPALGGASGFVIYFAFDRSEIGTTEQAKLDQVAGLLKQSPDLAAMIEGHCDDRGSDEYNRGLGERRALAVREYLAMAGVEDTRLETVSYGEEKPVVPNATNESEHAQNRRGVVILGTRN
ncbi:MAG: OmpA family protein [Lentisphaeria bacterium]|jgi:peptidoglycan-associated lipoprotein